ncbi:nitroreductase [Scopulibacillus darangshiensis]|uniref:Putative NAD(P)H nitroreductase n=1 Tax=Scopulibacillus darangshiensis TaxID=442528 RepID=A0A4R2PB84_9BACL|nr:nitroreductase [Scopulibacillus darangshiensis]TCP32369.1 nitroreductase [Scopulibacillus darangshiensis]
MDVIEAIHTRRSLGRVKEETPEKAEIEKVLEAARWAPNHFKTEPWRFTVLTGDGRKKLGDAYGQINTEKLVDPNEEEKASAYEKGIKSALRAPVIIVVTAEPSELERVKEIEEILATGCAVQNMLLAAHANGLGAIWRTGDTAYTDIMKKSFCTSDKGIVLGYVYLGYPNGDKPVTDKKPVEEVTTWVSE